MSLSKNKTIVVTGAGGFIGGNLVAELLTRKVTPQSAPST